MYVHGPGHFYTREDKPVAKLADLHGLRLRATGGIVQDISSLLGIVPQFTSASEAYEMISRGVVDGAMFNADSVVSFRLLSLMKNAYRVPGGLYRDSHYVIMNQNAYDKLSEQDRKAVDAESGEAFARLSGKAWDKVDAEAWQQMKEAGYTVVVASDEDVAHIHAEGDKLRDKWIANMKKLGVDGEAALAMFKEEIAKEKVEK